MPDDDPKNAARRSTPAAGTYTAAGDHNVCGLCGERSEPVNDHGDCRLCAEAQYGDR